MRVVWPPRFQAKILNPMVDPQTSLEDLMFTDCGIKSPMHAIVEFVLVQLLLSGNSIGIIRKVFLTYNWRIFSFYQAGTRCFRKKQ